MKETIYTIPINEAFDNSDACPVCALYNNLESDCLTYVTGAAMMEPDVRIETNRLGFCAGHYEKMLGMQKRLSLALILESHLGAIIENPSQLLGGKKCYVCSRIDSFFEKYLSNIIHLWVTSAEFRNKMDSHPKLCLPHMGSLFDAAQRDLRKKDFQLFSKVMNQRISAATVKYKESVSIFCKSFDHRFADMELGENKQAAERAIAFLTGKTV